MDKFWENYIKTRPADSKGAFDAFRKMSQEPRNMELASGYGSSTFDAHTKREAAFKAYKEYKKSYHGSRQRNPILTFRQFLPIYAKENYADGGRIGFKNGSERVQYKIPTKISDANRATFMGAKKIPLDHNWKVQLPDVDGTLFTETFKTKTSANEAIKNAPVTDMDYSKGLLKFDLPEGAVNFDDSRYKMDTGEFAGEGKNKSKIFSLHSKSNPDAAIKYYTAGADGQKRKLFNSIEEAKAGKIKFMKTIKEPVKVYSERIVPNINKVTYRMPGTNKEFVKYKPFIGENKVTIPGKGVDTLGEAQAFVDNYFKRNPKKVIVADPTKKGITKRLRTKKIDAAGGVETYLVGDKEVHKGHGTNIDNPDIKIKPSNIFATPEKINIAMAPKDTKAPTNIYTDIDFKINAEETKMKNIKNSNLSDANKKIELQKIDNKLVDLAIASDGYKTVTLSDGSTYNYGTKGTLSYDMADLFPPDMTEQDVKKFVSNYFTEEGKLKSKWNISADKISDVDKEGIKKSYIFLENVKNAKANAKKVLPKVEKEFKKFGITLNSDQVNKAKTFLRSAMNKGQNIFKFIPNKVVRKGGGAAVAVLDYALFHHLFGVPQTEALVAASGWLTKNDVLGKQIAATAGNIGMQEDPTTIRELVDLPAPYKDDDEVGTERLTEMTEVMKVPERKASGGPVELDFSLPEGFAGGGMAEIRRPSALPPTGGPQSGGLPSLYNNVRKW